MRSTQFAAIIVSISVTSSGISGAAIKWANSSFPYDFGNYPSAAQGVNTWADAHQGSSNALWYHASGQSAYHYANGYFPAVATDTWGNYIEMHQADSGPSLFWFTIGFDNGSGAEYMLGGASQDDLGMSPVIAVHGHNCKPPPAPPAKAFANIVQVHQAGSGAGPLWMNFAEATNINCNNNNYVGTPQWGGVQWFGAQQYSTGFYPSVAINSTAPGNGCVLEVHQDGPGLGTVSWRSGFISTSGSSWSFTETAYGTFTPAAQHPSVCLYDGNSGFNIADTGVVVMEFNDGSLWSFDGTIAPDPSTGVDCIWKPKNLQQYDHGAYPRVSCQSGLLSGRGGAQGIEVHQASSSTSAVQLWSRAFTE